MFNISECYGCFATEQNEAYFWHGRTNGVGGWENAWDIAETNGGKTLEMVMYDNREELEKQGVIFSEEDGIVYGGTDMTQEQFWNQCSDAFAAQASGDVHVIAGTDDRTLLDSSKVPESRFRSTYSETEHPAMVEKGKVDSISTVDPCTKQETGEKEVLKRGPEETAGLSEGYDPFEGMGYF